MSNMEPAKVSIGNSWRCPTKATPRGCFAPGQGKAAHGHLATPDEWTQLVSQAVDHMAATSSEDHMAYYYWPMKMQADKEQAHFVVDLNRSRAEAEAERRVTAPVKVALPNKQQSAGAGGMQRQSELKHGAPARQDVLAKGRHAQTLSTSLRVLSREDPQCLFIVRRINKLGFKAIPVLKRHFSAYGAVVQVLVAHSTVRQHRDPSSQARQRPSSLGFVQMATPEAVLAVLAVGAEQEVQGLTIRVQRFERQGGDFEVPADSSKGREEVEEEDKLARVDELARFRHGSTLSEATTGSTSASEWPPLADVHESSADSDDQ